MGRFGDTIKSVNKQVGERTFPDWVAPSMQLDFPHIPTGVLVFDIQTGIGGFPRGFITELFGPESCGKTTLALEAARECQETCKQAVLYLDYAHDFDPRYAKKLGVNLEHNWFGLTQPATAEEGLRLGKFLMKEAAGEIGLVIVDDVSSMNPMEDTEKELGESQPGSQARMMGRALRQLRSDIGETQTAWVFINQLRDVITIGWNPTPNVKQKTTSGGRALKFYAGLRVEFQPRVIDTVKAESILSDKEVKVMTGQRSRFEIIKNKLFRPYLGGELHLRPGEGFDSISSCTEIAVRLGLITKKTGGVFHIPQPFCGENWGEKTCRGEEQLYEFFKNGEGQVTLLVDEVRKALIAKLGA